MRATHSARSGVGSYAIWHGGARPRRTLTNAAVLSGTPEEVQGVPANDYELIVVGSGNGACAFLTKYLELTNGQDLRRVLVIEEGDTFLSTSAITHQANWTRSYAEKTIYKLHAATTGDAPGAGDRPIITGRACTFGGGGSLNYTMMHESSQWLATNFGAGGQFGEGYWEDLKAELSARFNRKNPAPERTPVAQAVHAALTSSSGSNGGGDAFADADHEAKAPWIPSYSDASPAPAVGRAVTFPTQFNDWGQRTNSGVSLVARGSDWQSTGRISVWTNTRVEALEFDQEAGVDPVNGSGSELPCVALNVTQLRTPKGPVSTRIKFDHRKTSVVLAAGSSTPRLLLPHRKVLANPSIGTGVNDHILIPAGFYLLKKSREGVPVVSPRDQYVNMFGLRQVDQDGRPVVISYDFFAGPVSELSYFLAHLFVALWLPNWAKQKAVESPWLFDALRQGVALILSAVDYIANFNFGLLFQGKAMPSLDVITGIAKFNCTYEGAYLGGESAGDASTRLVLKAFATGEGGERARDAPDTPDGAVVRAALPLLMQKLDVVGERPCLLLRVLLQWITKMPYDPDSVAEVDTYIKAYADEHLLTEQHLSGGCILGRAADDGKTSPERTGTVNGTSNVVVADLSASPLPRLSPQMTAYLLGYHVANQRFGGRKLMAAATAEAGAASAQ